MSPSPARLTDLVRQWRRSCEATRAELLTIRKDYPEGPRYGIAAVEQCADELEAALAAEPEAQPPYLTHEEARALEAFDRKARGVRCPALWANFNQCVRPVGHRESHLTDRGADWDEPLSAPPEPGDTR